MTDPRRLLSDPNGGLEAALLRAGVAEEPSPKAVERAVVAVGAGAATLGVVATAASAPAVATAATSLGVVGVTKLLVIGAVAGLASGGALIGVTKVVERREVKPAPAVASTVEGPVVAPAPPIPSSPLPPPAPADAPAVVMSAPRAAPAAAPPPEGTPLAAEVALVDRAHGMLRAGDAQGALSVLAAYEASFASPRLLPEAFALRMEASEQAGDGGGARLWASRLVSRYPRSAQAARARALLAASPEADR